MFNGKTLATAIRDKRLQANYTQEYVAFKLNMSQNAYSKLELGYTTISVSRFVEVCKILELDVFDMLRPLVAVA